MTRWGPVFVMAAALAACKTSHYERGHTWGIQVTEELNTLLTDAKLTAGIFSTPESIGFLQGKELTTEIHALLDAYKSSENFAFKEFPRSESFNELDPSETLIVTYAASRGTYLDLVVERETEDVRLLRLFKPTARDPHAQVVILREHDWERRAWAWADEGLVANSPAIVKAWKAFEARLQRVTKRVGFPRWANRAPGSNRIPFTILIPPFTYFPELN